MKLRQTKGLGRATAFDDRSGFGPEPGITELWQWRLQMTDTGSRTMARGELILLTAIDALGRYGVKGASLRDIARDAGTSLSLIVHHYTRKAGLVDAAVASLHHRSAEPARALKRRLAREPDLNFGQIIDAWLEYADAVFGGRTGAAYLRLLFRLRSDADVGAETRATLDDSWPVIRQAISDAMAIRDDEAIDVALDLTSTALHAGLLDEATCPDPAQGQARRATLQQFLVGGLSASLHRVRDAARSEHTFIEVS